MKICIKCNESKDEGEFHKDKAKSDGLVSKCRQCVKEYQLEYRLKNAGSISAKKKKEYQANRGAVINRSILWAKNNPERVRSIKARCQSKNKSKYADNYRKRYSDPEFAENKRLISRQWYGNNKRRAWDNVNRRSRERRRTDPDFQAASSLRNMLGGVMRRIGATKSESSSKILGYSASDLRKHIESKFKPGMGWRNRSDWHIDHKKPIAIFLKEGITDPAIINALDNLQPLWAIDNLRKGSKWNNQY
ncbi:MAG: hypothetical protein KAR42_15680 [candidate division Zixibacteria bacterium]|nr:hypothetical protein [candidate division Zixibacteria bacterium]